MTSYAHARRRSLAFIFAASLAIPGTGQSPPARGIDEQLERTIEACMSDAPLASLAPLIADYAKALTGQQEASAFELLARTVLEATGEEETPFSDLVTEALLEHVRARRNGPHPQRMLPMLLILERTVPQDCRVQMGLAEGFGIASGVFNGARAIAALSRVGEIIPAEDDGIVDTLAKLVQLPAFLGDLKAGVQGYTDLRDGIPRLLALLRDGRPIRPWRLADIEALRLHEDLTVARSRGEQANAVKLLNQLRTLQPGNPVYPLILAETLASLGPAWSPNLATKELRAFLAMTDPGKRTAVPADELPWTDTDTATVMRILGLSRASDKLSEVRVYAKGLLQDLPPADASPQPLLISPDKTMLGERVDALRSEHSGKSKEHDRAAKELAAARVKLRKAEQDYQRERTKPIRRGTIREVDAAYGRLQTCENNVRRLEAKMSSLEKTMSGLRERLVRYEARLGRF